MAQKVGQKEGEQQLLQTHDGGDPISNNEHKASPSIQHSTTTVATCNLDPQMKQCLSQNFLLLQKKSAKKKTEIDERDVPILLRSMGLNPTHKQIESIIMRARESEAATTSRGHLEYENFERHVAEALIALDKEGFSRHSQDYLVAALQTISPKGQDYINPEDFKKIMMDKGICFNEEEAEKMLRVAKDKDTGKVWHEDYADILAYDGILRVLEE
ncbi:hypothetical protein O6H91_06G011400 [Diphasiastrum complanatum]|nr:hypothetical protein O6H91_06G011400 [Diphasiastrum complanatum]